MDEEVEKSQDDGNDSDDNSVKLPYHAHLISQLDRTRSSAPEIAKEIREIYAGLLMIEEKCINAQRHKALDQDAPAFQWQSLVKLHGLLLDEHYIFFQAC